MTAILLSQSDVDVADDRHPNAQKQIPFAILSGAGLEKPLKIFRLLRVCMPLQGFSYLVCNLFGCHDALQYIPPAYLSIDHAGLRLTGKGAFELVQVVGIVTGQRLDKFCKGSAAERGMDADRLEVFRFECL